MAHEVETMAYANQVPWHGLGANVSQDATVEEMAQAAGLNWSMIPVVPTIKLPSGRTHAMSDRLAWVRDSDEKIIASSSSQWRPMQPAQTLEFMRNYVQAGEATLETAGSLRGGKIVWCLARLKHEFEVGRGDKVRGYLLITAPNVVGQSNSVRLTTIRVVCANTVAEAEGQGAATYRQSHMSDFDADSAKAAVGAANERLAQAEANAKTLLKLKLSVDDAIKRVLVPVFAPDLVADEEMVEKMIAQDELPRKVAGIVNSIMTGPGQDGISETGWGVLNGVTHWADHVAGNSNAGRMYRSWMGDHGRAKLKARELLLQLAA